MSTNTYTSGIQLRKNMVCVRLACPVLTGRKLSSPDSPRGQAQWQFHYLGCWHLMGELHRRRIGKKTVHASSDLQRPIT